MITIRMANASDAALIANLSHETFYDTFAAVNTKEDMDIYLTEQFNKEELMKEVTEEGNIFFLAYENDVPMGYVRMRETANPDGLGPEPSIEIVRLYATTQAIGKGVGKVMMEKCIAIAKERNKKIIWLGVWEHNERAIRFYTKWGFERFGEHPFILGKDHQTDWLMKKIL